MSEGTGNIVSRQVNFSESIWKTLTELANEDCNGDVSEALKQAIASKQWLRLTRKEGIKIHLEYPDGHWSEVVKDPARGEA